VACSWAKVTLPGAGRYSKESAAQRQIAETASLAQRTRRLARGAMFCIAYVASIPGNAYVASFLGKLWSNWL
jgi:hypothetical protein